MITIATAESALKNIYLESVIHDINTKTNPFLTMIGQNTKTVAEKDAKAFIRYGGENSVIASTEDGALPLNDAKLAEIIVPLKNLFGTFQVTDKALKASQNNPGAFASLIGGEMTNLVSTAQNNLNRMIYGNGNPHIGTISQVDRATRTIHVPNQYRGNFQIGMPFQVLDPNNRVIVGSGSAAPTVFIVHSIGESSAVHPNHFTVVHTPESSLLPNLRFDQVYIYPAIRPNVEMNGIDSIFMPNEMYNLRKADYPEIIPFVQVDTGAELNIINEDVLLEFFYNLEAHAGVQSADIIMTHPLVRKALFENLKDNRSNIDVTEFAGGFKGFSFNGIPMYSDMRCRPGTVYALNSQSFAMQQLCDWTWLEGDDGNILRPISGKPVYNATLVKYADLICEKPFLQGKLTGFSARRWR